MKRKSLRELAHDPRFIPGVYNYCDRWCERCPLSNRCLNYAMEKEGEDGDPAARDLANEKFWQKLHETFQDTIRMVRADAKARGIDLDDPTLRAAVVAQEKAERRRAAKNRPLARAAMAYVKAADQCMDGAKPSLAAKVEELKTQARLEIGDPLAEVQRLSDFTDAIRWYQHFIYVKLRRAIDSRAGEELETDEEMKKFPRDSDGSAKIALIAMDRSISAWAGMHEALGDEADGILDLLAQLTTLRRETEALFPTARAFVRPGFDESAKTE
ncbi:MAG: hypothetical protein HYY24_19500 [Verrucomicrobia bacterium]|nr:hypothetical protein [Verrucomicrobiota bacterium]